MNGRGALQAGGAAPDVAQFTAGATLLVPC